LPDVFLLATFAQLTAFIRQAATYAANAQQPKERHAAYKQLQEMAKTQATLCTKLRMAPQPGWCARRCAPCREAST
jgi:hypothetical protein